ncbi:hypothetical protein COCHEDRAFT_79388 [Bipolaris maydis C5]|uniref:Histidine kinase n=2 Tax=Cochliobolus heterostrophus TaxID=5016 RepID=M2U9X8_COCH5|nr:putative histidine kinase HHK16p [Bipolaris maydis]EMD90546.1 hypothetical protein COCHEDRAFT_79388 [Bipolaris maydis C5]KAJ5023636.1 hypothetical protein J3E73DRAFT_216742 [Bipolaris maydis]KAJ5058420.1 putative histidine kinase HHK16p [Bipolaris maydis]KAJ6206450.1 putative histidine kinase HHK16p [Bipolaris maydis]
MRTPRALDSMDSQVPENPTRTAPPVHPKKDRQDGPLNRLNTSSLPQLLDMDDRPTFVLNMENHVHGNQLAVRPIFCNAALRRQEQLFLKITGSTREDPEESDHGTNYEEFRIWATTTSKFRDSRDIFPLTIEYAKFIWTVFCILPNWRVITGHPVFRSEDIPGGGPLSASAPESQKKWHGVRVRDDKKALASAAAISIHEIVENVQQPEFQQINIGSEQEKSRTSRVSAVPLAAFDSSAVPDWTAAHPKGVLSEHLKFVRSIDWSKTPLGAMNTWTIQFREILCLVMRNPHPSCVFWGEDLTMIYNESHRNIIAGDKHPALMGTGFTGPFRELWGNSVRATMRESARTGQAQFNLNQMLPVIRHGYLEEAFFTWSFVGINTLAYSIMCRLHDFSMNSFDTTVESLRGRRMELLRYLGERLNATRTVKEFWGRVLDGLAHNDYDVPFALLYSIVDAEDIDHSSLELPNTSPSFVKTCIIEGSIGVPRGHQACPERFSLTESDDTLISAFIQATRTLEPLMLHVDNGTLPQSLLEIIEWRGYKDPCREAMILPLRPTNADNVCALLLLGINPRRAYDKEYESFTSMLNRQIATSLASVLLFEDEVRRSKRAAEVAALQREELSQQLQLQTSRMRRMTEFSPLGMCLFDADGHLLEANDRYFEMTGISHDTIGKCMPNEMMPEQSLEVAQSMWDELLRTHKPTSRELQYAYPKFQAKDIDGEPIEYWVLVSCQPELSPNGELISIMSTVTDISHLKWAQGLQERRLREAEEAKRQQNEFIDITSHEMRNPLSAILISADDIGDTLSVHQFSCDEDRNIAKNCIEAANNIALCVQHQKSIVDDILTVSKLDSNLLRMTPIPSQPIAVVERAIAMLRPEVVAKSIDLEFKPHPSLQELNIDWAMLDSGRLLQIIVNLITNAIKFTQDRPTRSIVIHIRACAEKPDFELPNGFEFVPQRIKLTDCGNGEDWGTGSPVFLLFQVQDTGCGLTPEQKKLLFEKFAQASPRTHGKYGGSGLGLFISRQLAELHGGQIGCTSEAGVGSTFGFYLKSRRMTPQDCQLLEERARKSPNTEIPAYCLRNTSQAFPRMHNQSQPISSNAHNHPGQQTNNKPTQQLHVLVVEDNHLNQKILCKQLTKAGCITATADNGVHALDYLTKTQFCTPNGIPLSMVLMDCEMPEMDGLTCCRKIREMEQRKQVLGHVPIIAVTANIRCGQIDEARESGMDDVIGKPFRIPELLDKMRGLLERLEREQGVGS